MAQLSSQRNIVIVGGSYGGLSVAHYLLKHAIPHLPEKDTHQVIIVCPAKTVLCRPACPRALISDDMLPQEKLFVDIPKLFASYPSDRFRFIHAGAIGSNLGKRQITVRAADKETEELDFYALVIATGASTSSPLLGLNVDDKFLRDKWKQLRQALPNAKNITIAGGGPAGVETAGELGEYLNGRVGWPSAKLEHPKVNITIINAGARILPSLRPSLAEKGERYLTQSGVTVINNTRVKAVEPAGAGTQDVAAHAKLTLKDDSGETEQDADIYIPATGTKPNSAWLPTDILAGDGRVDTNAKTLRVDQAGPRVYAIGDVASYSRPAIHLILNAVPIVCANIKRDLQLAAGVDAALVKEDQEFKEDVRETQLVPIGKRKGVGAAMGWRLASFLVWLIKGRDYWLWTTGNLWSGKQWAKES